MSRPQFSLQARAPGSNARAGLLSTRQGLIETPFFMPVGTNATVKGLRVDDLSTTGTRMMLANAYHLLLRPGPGVFEKLGGIHRMIDWDGSVLTDSGGFQVFSLPNSRTIGEKGASFRSYVDGRVILFTPELSIATQISIGSDIMMVLDHCIPATSYYDTAREAMELTHRWAERCLAARGESGQGLFGIVQGALIEDLRRASAETLSAMPFDGYAIGGLAVGETKQEREEFTAFTAALLPPTKPRYLMGVGTPIDLLEGVNGGVDMFDCIIPTALSQQGVAYTSRGKMRLTRSVYKLADEPLDPACLCRACSRYTKAYLHHLLKASESLGWQLVSIHNLTFYNRLMKSMREHVLNGTFSDFYRTQRETLAMQDEDRPPAAIPKPRTGRLRTKGAFALHETPAGMFSIKHVASGEVMHPGDDPNIEARRLYVEQAQLGARLSGSEAELVIWDVGLGAAHNAMAAVHAFEEQVGPEDRTLQEEPGTVRLRILSFENDMDALRLALHHVGRFNHLKHPAPHWLLKEGHWQGKSGIRWELAEGDFLERMRNAPMPHFVFYDPFSYKTDHGLWTHAAFAALRTRCDGDTELYSYTASTRVRAALLSAGFFVARGVSSGRKTQTTMALTGSALQRRRAAGATPELLSEAWLDRWERSDARFPFGLAADERAEFERRIRSHAQFATPPNQLTRASWAGEV